ncbi:MAG: hypothetical protein KTR16_13145 [Acidiferrobacterales bacterium]|nr:hypothetical protein [Acidiferrobacterales bacterium]
MKTTQSTHALVRKLSMRDYQSPQTRDRFSQELLSSLADCGFAKIIDHGIAPELMEKAYRLCQELFALPLDDKKRYQVGRGGKRGYTEFGNETASGSEYPDLKEFWHIGPELNPQNAYANHYPNNQWPTEVAEFKSTFLQLYQELRGVALTLLNALSSALGINKNYFANLVEDGNSVLRLIHYPAILGVDASKQMRAAPHADINLMTLLFGATDSGLQLLDKNNQWVDVETLPDEIVIDTGDMMALLTGGYLPATVHRVVNPDKQNKARYSMPFFLHPHGNAELIRLEQFRGFEETQQPPITADDFLNQRLRENGLLD